MENKKDETFTHCPPGDVAAISNVYTSNTTLEIDVLSIQVNIILE